MQTYLGSPTPTKTGGGITMTNVKTVINKTVTIPAKDILSKLGLSGLGKLKSVEIHNIIPHYGDTYQTVELGFVTEEEVGV